MRSSKLQNTILNDSKIYSRYLKFNICKRKAQTIFKSKKLNAVEISFVRSKLDEDCTLTLRELKQLISEMFGKIIAISTLSNYISGFFIVLRN
jgi:hypothetical protein